MEDAAAAEAAHQESNSIKSPSKSLKSPTLSAKSSNKSPKSRTGVEETVEQQERFSGLSCLLITWKTNPEVENFKDRYMDKVIKTHKRKNTTMVDPGDLVTEKSLSKYYRIIGKVMQLPTQTTFQRNFKLFYNRVKALRDCW